MGGDTGQKKSAEAGLQQTGANVTAAAAQTPQEDAQYSGSFDIGKFLQQYFGGQVGMNAMPSGAQNATQQYTGQGALQQGLYNQSLQDVQNPYGSYESALQPALQQAQEQINSYYQKRGLLNSGIAIGDMGTAGVDLAIQEAQGKMQARQQALSNASTLSNQINTYGQNNIGNLANLYSNEQGFGLQSLGRQSQGAQAGAQYTAAPYTAQLGNYYGAQAALQALPGQLIGAAGKVGSAAVMA